MSPRIKAATTKTKKEKDHGWHGIGKGVPPFPGAAPPIHLHHGGKYLKSKKPK